ncbi:MAG: hypothetical protein QJT81_17835 [Candidatus Thiothrix putei]|uniref:Uncharacterized protein n=1 Tax=Candidatus Thiothrix putei TaxID=3080811 RepID=A0AA95KLC5_9GAMM|nr:MAG: hypothetical protein QJT81_17835 [Candidatus Thiothrix putei]
MSVSDWYKNKELLCWHHAVVNGQINEVEFPMPKLVIKQDLPEVSIQEKLEGLLRVVLPVLLAVIAVAALLSLYITRDSVMPGAAIGDSGQQIDLPAMYTEQEERLNKLGREFEAQEKTELESYNKHSTLVVKANELLTKLAELDGKVASLDVPTETKQALLSRHQYQKDYWEAKRVFHHLRLSHFAKPVDAPALAATVTVPQEPDETIPSQTTEKRDGKLSGEDAAPVPALPDGFCPLFGPGAKACRPDTNDKAP